MRNLSRMFSSTKKIQKKTCEHKLKECLIRERAKNSTRNKKVAEMTADFVFAHREYSRHVRDLAICKYNENRPNSIEEVNAKKFEEIQFNTERMKNSFEKIGVPYSMLTDILTAIKVGNDKAHKFNHKNNFIDLEKLQKNMEYVIAESTAKHAFRRLASLWKRDLHKIAKTTRKSPYCV